MMMQRKKGRITALVALGGWLAALGCSSGDVTPSEGSSPTTTTATSESVGSSTQRLVTMPGPLNWWSFDEFCSGTTVYDTLNMQSGANGSKANGAACAEGKIAGGVAFDGADDVVTIPDRWSLHFTNAFTISAWVYPTKTSGQIAGKWYTKNSYQLALSGGKFTFSIGRGSPASNVTVNATAAQNTWSHVTGVYDGSKISIYVNGVLQASTATSGSITDSTAALAIGNSPGTSNVGFKGTIDEVKVFNTALSATTVDRLANGLQHRRLRGVVVDPKLSDGRYLHQAKSADGWRSPDEVFNWWLRSLNEAAGEPFLYLPEDGSATAALKFVNKVPWNNGNGGCPAVKGTTPYLVSGDEYLATAGAPPTVGGVQLGHDAFALFDPAVAGFDMIADANAGKFHEVAVIVPDTWGIGGEGVMVARSDDNTAWKAHDGLMRQPNLRADRKFHMHGVSFPLDDSNFEQFFHRVEVAMAHAFSPYPAPSIASDPCGTNGSWTPYPDLHSVWDLFTVLDKNWNGNGQVGHAHAMANSDFGYERAHEDAVPATHNTWANFPTGFPLDLTVNSRRTRLSCADWSCTDPHLYLTSMIWQLSKIPKGDGKYDGRWANWWKYITDPNIQTGRGTPVTAPTKGPFQGALDAALKILPTGIELSWRTEVSSLGSYSIRRSTDRANWATVASSLSGSTSSYVLPRPATGVATFYQVLWNNGGTTRYSDMLGAKTGTLTGSKPPLNPQIALYQQNVPYVRWVLPTTCDATFPCSAEHGIGCAPDNVCRQGMGSPWEEQASDYHLGVTTYYLKKVVSGAQQVAATIHRKPGWEGQYSHVRFSAAEYAQPAGSVVEYLAEARDASDQMLGTTDTVLAVVGQSSVGY
jgi:hypothetical protein